MNTSNRFAVAVHALTLLATREARPITSERIAQSVCANPVTIRHILGSLRRAELVTAHVGSGGGWQLVRSADAISLCDVYRAVEDDTLFPLHHRPPNPDCIVGRNIQDALRLRFDEAKWALEAQLSTATVADVARDVVAPIG